MRFCIFALHKSPSVSPTSCMVFQFVFVVLQCCWGTGAVGVGFDMDAVDFPVQCLCVWKARFRATQIKIMLAHSFRSVVLQHALSVSEHDQIGISFPGNSTKQLEITTAHAQGIPPIGKTKRMDLECTKVHTVVVVVCSRFLELCSYRSNWECIARVSSV